MVRLIERMLSLRSLHQGICTGCLWYRLQNVAGRRTSAVRRLIRADVPCDTVDDFAPSRDVWAVMPIQATSGLLDQKAPIRLR